MFLLKVRCLDLITLLHLEYFCQVCQTWHFGGVGLGELSYTDFVACPCATERVGSLA